MWHGCVRRRSGRGVRRQPRTCATRSQRGHHGGAPFVKPDPQHTHAVTEGDVLTPLARGRVRGSSGSSHSRSGRPRSTGRADRRLHWPRRLRRRAQAQSVVVYSRGRKAWRLQRPRSCPSGAFRGKAPSLVAAGCVSACIRGASVRKGRCRSVASWRRCRRYTRQRRHRLHSCLAHQHDPGEREDVYRAT